MTNIKEYKQKKITEALETEDEILKEVDVILNKEEIRVKNGASKTLDNMDYLNMIMKMGLADEEAKEAFEKYSDK